MDRSFEIDKSNGFFFRKIQPKIAFFDSYQRQGPLSELLEKINTIAQITYENIALSPKCIHAKRDITIAGNS